jgi:hypothetical protein
MLDEKNCYRCKKEIRKNYFGTMGNHEYCYNCFGVLLDVFNLEQKREKTSKVKKEKVKLNFVPPEHFKIFLKERCRENPLAQTTATQIYEHYKKWIQNKTNLCAEVIGSVAMLGKYMKRLQYVQKKVKKSRYYQVELI